MDHSALTFDGMSAERLQRLLDVPQVLVFSQVGSTQDVLRDLAAKGAASGTLVVAEEQTHGRGRRGTFWHSGAGRGLWMSYLYRPMDHVVPGTLSIRVGLAVVSTLKQLGIDAKLKWPNDVLVEDRKICGVLCESRWAGTRLDWVIAGVGLNIRPVIDQQIGDSATSVEEHVDRADRIGCLKHLITSLHDLGFLGRLTSEECDTLKRLNWLRGKRIVEPGVGIVLDIKSDGALVVQGRDGLTEHFGGRVVVA